MAVTPDDGPAFFANDECVVRPAARTRRMSAGGTIDLGVYQFLVTEIDPKRGLRELRLDECFGEALEDVDGTTGGVDEGASP